MDVSRIEAISPKQIDWRKLTSQEIIKYDAQGVDVPSEYLQWAKEFRADINASDKDDTTYEMANSSAVTEKPAADTALSSTAENTTEGVTDEDSTTQTDEEQPEEEKTEAQTKREELEDAGVSLRKQAKIFTSDSKSSSKELAQSITDIEEAQSSSNNEIAALETYMEKILSDAENAQNELKAEVDKINDSKNDANAFSKINKLEKQLERYGNEAQANAAGTETDLIGYDSTINAQTENILRGSDFGSETVDVGNDLMNSISGSWFWRIIDRIIAKNAINSGNNAVDMSEKTADIQTEALDVNAENIAKTNEYKIQVEDKTGVAGIDTSNDANNNNTAQENKNGTEKSSTSANDTNAQTQSDTDKAASGNLDQILQSKIRKGEVIES